MRSSPDEVHCSRRLAKHDGRYVPVVQTQECSNRYRAIAATPIESLRTQPCNTQCIHCHHEAASKLLMQDLHPQIRTHLSGLQGWVLCPCARTCAALPVKRAAHCTIKRVLLSVCGLPAVAIPSSDRAPPVDAVPHAQLVLSLPVCGFSPWTSSLRPDQSTEHSSCLPEHTAWVGNSAQETTLSCPPTLASAGSMQSSMLAPWMCTAR